MRRHSATNSAAFGSRAATASGERMLRRQGQERHAEQRVRPRRVDFDGVDDVRVRRQPESQPRALAAADPLGLHHAHPLRPAIHAVQRGQQLRRIAGDFQEPLRQQLLLDRRAGTPAAAVDHLLVREHRAVHRVPVHPALAPLDETGAEEIQEQLLLLPVIIGIAGGELAGPVERQPHAPQFGAHGGDVVPGPFGRVDAALARRVLRRQAERVPAHRMQHGIAPRALVARHHIAQRVIADVTHVDLAAGIREHLQHVIFRLAVGGHVGDAERPALLPDPLPAGLRHAEIV